MSRPYLYAAVAEASLKGFFGSRRQLEDVVDFWSRSFAGARKNANTLTASLPLFEQYFWNLIGDVRGRDVLEIGCGLGDNTLRLACAGARVTAIDISAVAIEHVRQRLDEVGLSAKLRVMDAFELREVDWQFDLIAGRFILHHLEPFGTMAEILAARLRPNGRMVFAENNARNKALMLARKYLAGRYGIPRYGDAFEQPLSPAEIGMLKACFADLKCHFPTMVFFSKLNTYLFRHRPVFRPVTLMLDRLDEALWRGAPQLRPWSYNQIITARWPVERPARD